MRSQCSEKLNKVIDALNVQGATVYFVGGCVRDWLMGHPCVDFDLEIFGIEDEKLVEVLKQFGPVDYFGKQFGIYKLLNIPEADFALPRKEKKIDHGHQGFDVTTNPYLSVKEAALRRDFTMNALYYNTKTNTYEDYYGGIDDLKHRLMRVVNPSTFIEDPLRVLRGAQFASRFQFSVAPETIELCKGMDLNTLASERIFEDRKMQLLMLGQRLDTSIRNELTASRNLLARNSAKLEALSPLGILSRGYSVATKSDGSVVKSVKDVSSKDNVYLRLSDGSVDVTVN